MKSLLHALLIACLLASAAFTSTAQNRRDQRSRRPKSAAAAVAAFEQVRQQEERSRFAAIRDLGRFAEADATRVLLAELARAQTMSYRQAVVRAIGYKVRQGCIPPLQDVLTSAVNPRMADAAADAMRRQGDAGIAALVDALGDADAQRAQRNAVCYALGKVDRGDAVRDALLNEIQRIGGNDRLPPLRGLAARANDPAVDAARVMLAGDKSALVAATALEQLARHRHAEAPRLGIDLLRRLTPTSGADLYAAAMAGMLVAPTAEAYRDLMRAAARAEDPFGDTYQQLWQQLLGQPDFQKSLASSASSSRDAAVKLVIARALALSPKEQLPSARGTLLALLRTGKLPAVRAAATSLASVAPDNVTKDALQELLQRGKPATAAVAVGALHSMLRDDAAWQAQLLLLTKHKRPALRATALRCLIANGANSEGCFHAARNNLSYRDWPVRAAAIELLVATRSRKAPPLLFSRLEKERARMREDVRTALRQLTGLQFASLKEWQVWWQKEGDRFQPRRSTDDRPGRNADSKTVSYWDIPVLSDRATFVVDVSGSMRQPFGTGSGTRLDEARRQLARVFDQVPKQAKINVVTFASGTDLLFQKLQPLSKKRRKQAAAFCDGLAAKGPTNVHDALAAAFAAPDVDTIFVLTDGRPSVGPIVAAEALADEVQRWNLERGIRIHTIAIGEQSKFLERLARDSGGEHSVAR